jgi:thymidylate synthase ThyX
MGSTVKVLARTFETDDDTPEKLQHDLTVLSGRAAGTCYASDDYFSSGIHDEDKAISRAKMTANNGHHSVYDHGHITFQIETNKMMCMILNSLGVYATSEKSARYTQMKPETELELNLYDKWLAKIQSLILSKYPDMDDVQLNAMVKKRMENVSIKNGELAVYPGQHKDEALAILKELRESKSLQSYKLSQENARYMISVFTPTSMIYTTSYRQIMLTIQYLDSLVVDSSNLNDELSIRLSREARYLSIALQDAIGDMMIADTKGQYIRFLPYQHTGDPTHKFKYEYALNSKYDYFGDSYTYTREMSIACLAQAQRHRTLRHEMFIETPGQFGFYTPEIIKENNLEDEWLSDIKSVQNLFPQGTMVRVTEQGIFEDFVLKCKERMCGRAQLEIMRDTSKMICEFFVHKNNLSPANRDLLESICNIYEEQPFPVEEILKPRCRYSGFVCESPCRWGVKKALTRTI